MEDAVATDLRRRERMLIVTAGPSSDVTDTERPSQLARARRRAGSDTSRLAQARRQIAARTH